MKEIKLEFNWPSFGGETREKIKTAIFVVFLATALVLKFKLDWPFWEMLVLDYFLTASFWKISDCFSIGLFLFFLTLCPILLFLEKKELADASAVNAYYFLAITVWQKIRGLWITRLDKWTND